MNRDPLRESTEALRNRYNGSSDRSSATEARIVSSIGLRFRARRKRLLVLLPLAAAFVASTTWAGSTGRLRPLVSTVRHLFSGVREITPATHAPRLPPGLGLPPASSATSSFTDDASNQVSVQPAAPARAEHARAALSAHRVLAPTASIEPPPREDPNALYRAAHHAHFVDRDSAAAVVAWDRYLLAAPHGTMAPEARYNRAIDLTRLGRRSEAIAAFQPFADGEYGPYHQADARVLIAELLTGR